MIRRKTKPFLYLGIAFSASAFFVVFHFSTEKETHHLVKRRAEMPPADDENYYPPHIDEFPPTDNPPNDDQNPPGIEHRLELPGQLTCQRPPVNPNVVIDPFSGVKPPPDVGGSTKEEVIPAEMGGKVIDVEDPKDMIEAKEKQISKPSPVVSGGKTVEEKAVGVKEGGKTEGGKTEGGATGGGATGGGATGGGATGGGATGGENEVEKEKNEKGEKDVNKERGEKGGEREVPKPNPVVSVGGGETPVVVVQGGNGGDKTDKEKDKEESKVDMGGAVDSGSVSKSPDMSKEIDKGKQVFGNKKVESKEEKEEGPLVVPPVKRPVVKEPIVNGWTDKEKYIGCCPSGDSNGVAFKEGMACCIDQVYNATEMFCCLSKRKAYSINRQNLMFCYPPDRIPFCRLSDLGLEDLRPLDAVCKTKGGKNKDPSECTFICPPGSQVRGDKRVTCSEVGTWNDANPQCCEGCPPDFKQDIWFLVDIEQGIGVGNLSSVRSFIRQSIGYFPIGKDKVRVAVTPYNSRIFAIQGGWYLNQHNTLEALNRAINKLPREGYKRNTGEVLAWLAEEGFEGRLGDRIDVPNLIVLITTGPPDDNHLQDALEVVRDLSRFIIVTVGPNADTKQFQQAVSSPQSENYLHAPTFHYLDEDAGYLYSLLCQEHCLEPEVLPK